MNLYAPTFLNNALHILVQLYEFKCITCALSLFNKRLHVLHA